MEAPSHAHSSATPEEGSAGSRLRSADQPVRVALVGSPNVGKSALFNALTGRYVTVSNYPGTTVEVSRGRLRRGGLDVELVDTPGMYGLLSISDEERVSRRILLDERPDVVVHVLDAKNLERMLPLSLQLAELGLPMVVVLNMMDEAERLGIEVQVESLAEWLGVPVIPAVATRGEGVDALVRAVGAVMQGDRRARRPVSYGAGITGAAEDLGRALQPQLGEDAHALSLLLLQGDEEVARELAAVAPEAIRRAEALRSALEEAGDDPAYEIARRRHELAQGWIDANVHDGEPGRRTFSDRLGDLLVRPVFGVPVLLLVLYLGLYQFVGVFGAGTVVDFLESHIFGEWVNPAVESGLLAILPGEVGVSYWLRELIGGDYGIVTLGITYAVAIVLPIVFLFFLFFSVLEDSGYFPRLALLVDRLFKRIGLNGRAVIPVVLGFACDTMATMVTRIQETRRERILTTLLLAMAIPCSAQYGVIAALLAAQPGNVLGMSYAFLTWVGVVAVIFFLTGLIASKVVPGPKASFYMELPPLRLPRLGNVLAKTFARMKWYFVEIIPFFILASVLIWAGRLTGLFAVVVEGLNPLVRLLGLPESTSEIFLYGFFRRDFGAAGLYDLVQTETLSAAQLLIAGVTLTLFLPCVAQLLVMYKERGARTTAIMVGVVMTTAFLVGGLMHAVLAALGMMG